tara:strand:+ start:1698 stop:3716 length:2019 start_codon:yes stop_codon:yes gene_type:complete
MSTNDPWFWLRHRDDPAVLEYLRAENDWTDRSTEQLGDLREHLFNEIRSRVQEEDQSVPVPKGEWEYRVRTGQGLQYPVHVRQLRGEPTTEEVLLDENDLATGLDYFSVGDLSVSPNHRLLAYTVDTEGNEEYELTVLDLETRDVVDSGIGDLSYGLVWANDSHTLFMVLTDEARRPDRVIRHEVGTDQELDVTVFTEADERFWVGVGVTRSERFIVIGSESKMSSEYWLLDADSPASDLSVIEPRREGHEYRISHQGNRLLILTNDNAVDFRLMEAPVHDAGYTNWEELIPHRAGVRLEDVDVFETFMVVTERRQGIPIMRVLDHEEGSEFEIDMSESIFEAGPGANAEYSTRAFRYGYTSMITPPSTYEINIDTREQLLLKQQAVLGDADLSVYRSERSWSTSDDGTKVPISLVWRPSAVTWPAPTVIYGYGAYEIGIPASFSSARLSLLDRGVVFAVAHVRGGGELGRNWYEQGRLEHKQNTFSDFGSCRDHLVNEGWADPQRIVARGGSAGGLLMGVMVNQRPDAFAGVVAEVPFVDNVNTMLDPTIPLTITEYEEWGNPNDPATFEMMHAYGPYENVKSVDHPALLVTAGLNDPRVQYWEPAKWVAKLRSETTGSRPILLRTEIDSGHGGPSGRYDAWREEAFVLSVILEMLNLAPPLSPTGDSGER